MRLGGYLYRIRQTNLGRKQDQVHQNAPRPKSRFGDQVDTQVECAVDLVLGVSTAQSTPLSTWVVCQSGLGAPDLFLKTCLEVSDVN